jgi:hypothetical protein
VYTIATSRPVLPAGQADHLFGKQSDRHRLAHVECVDRLMRADRRCLQDQLAGFSNRHEEARDFRIGHGNRTAVADLFAEQRHHASGGVEDVAETHGDEAGRTLLGLRLADHFRHSLAGAEHIGRIDRFVGRDQDERTDAGAAAGGRDGFGR